MEDGSFAVSLNMMKKALRKKLKTKNKLKLVKNCVKREPVAANHEKGFLSLLTGPLFFYAADDCRPSGRNAMIFKYASALTRLRLVSQSAIFCRVSPGMRAANFLWLMPREARTALISEAILVLSMVFFFIVVSLHNLIISCQGDS